MARRFQPITDPVVFELDGEPIEAERGEPLAFALIANDRLALARSPKFHRPRGPTCLRGACDGCLLRVGGEPNVLACLSPCAGGEQASTQNVLGTRELDALQIADWFFPKGFDHHHLLAGIPGADAVLTPIARRMAGLGTLPDETAPAALGRAAPSRGSVDVAIVGAGLAGLTAAAALAGGDWSVAVFDDGTEPGGSLRARDPARAEKLASEAVRRGARIHPRCTVAGVYERDLLVVDRPEGARVITPRALILATGMHDGVAVFDGNDLPGVFSARAAALLATRGIAVGERLCLLGDGPYLAIVRARLLAAGHAKAVLELPLGAELAASGGLRVRAVRARDASEGGAKLERHRVDAVVVEGPGAPSFELAAQAGAEVKFDPARGGYAPLVDDSGRAGSQLWCAGELAGSGTEPGAIAAQAERAARSVAAALRAGR